MPAKKASSRIQATVHKRERDKNPIDSVHSEMLPMSNRQRKQAAQPSKKKDQSTRYLYGMFPEKTYPVVQWKYCFAWVLVMDDSNVTEHKGHYTLTR